MKVLVITSDPQEMLIVNDTLKREGYEVIRAINGPFALEYAVTEEPSIVIMGEKVNVIEPIQLTQILKNNPKLRDVPFIFIGFEDRDMRFSVHDRKISKPIKEEELALIVNSLSGREETQKKVEEKKELKGTLEGERIADFLMTLVNSGADGTLILTKGERRGYVYFENGSIVNANIDKIEGEKALFRILMWDKCEYEFVPVRSLTPVRIRKPGNILLIDAVRQIEEYNAFKDKLPLANLIVKPKITVSSLPPHSSPLIKEVILLTEVYRKVEEIVNACSYPDVQVLKTLAVLAKKGYISLKTPTARMKFKEPFIIPEYLQMLKERLMGGKGEVREKVRGVFYLFMWDRNDINRFKKMAQNYQEFSFTFRNPASVFCFNKIGRISISENIEIDLLFLIPQTDYFPFYSVLSNQVLGNMVFVPSNGKNKKKIETLLFYLTNRISAPVKLCSFEKKPELKEIGGMRVYLISEPRDLKAVVNEIIGEQERR